MTTNMTATARIKLIVSSALGCRETSLVRLLGVLFICVGVVVASASVNSTGFLLLVEQSGFKGVRSIKLVRALSGAGLVLPRLDDWLIFFDGSVSNDGGVSNDGSGSNDGSVSTGIFDCANPELGFCMVDVDRCAKIRDQLISDGLFSPLVADASTLGEIPELKVQGVFISSHSTTRFDQALEKENVSFADTAGVFDCSALPRRVKLVDLVFEPLYAVVSMFFLMVGSIFLVFSLFKVSHD